MKEKRIMLLSALMLFACSGRRANQTAAWQKQEDSLHVSTESLQAGSQPDCKADSSRGTRYGPVRKDLAGEHAVMIGGKAKTAA